MRKLIAVSLLLVLAGFAAVASADCTEVPGFVTCTGTDDTGVGPTGVLDTTIIIDQNDEVTDNVSAWAVAGGDGNDTITVSDDAYIEGSGDGISGGNGNDTIIVEDNATVIGNGDRGIEGWVGNDTVIVSGSPTITGVQGINTDPGDDIITITGSPVIFGTVDGVTGGDGNDVITISGNADITGVAQNGVEGWNGNDTITITGDVTISGTTAIMGDGGVDQISVEVSVTVNGAINGGAGIDTLTLTGTTADQNEIDQVQALVGCNPCSGTVTIDGRTYTFLNFEQLVNLITLYVPPVPVATPVEVVVVFDPPTPYDDMNCQNGVRCFALKDEGFRNGNVQIYAAEGDRGVGVATVNFRLLGTAGYTYTNPDNGWTVTITYLGTEGDARTYSIMLAKGDEVRNAVTTVLAFQYEDAVFATHALAWR